MKPSIDFTVEITGPTGSRYRWGASAHDPRDIPLSVRFTSRPGKGFDACSMQLSRRLDAEYPDLQIEHEVRIIGADGKIWWEGFTQSAPRERTMDGDSITVEALGWMDDAAGQEFVDLIVDRDHGHWGELWLERRLGLKGSGYLPVVGPSVRDDGSILLSIDRLAQSGAAGKVAGMAYTSPVPIGRVEVQVGAFNANISGANWRFLLRTHPSKSGASDSDATDHVLTGSVPSAGNTFTVEPANSARYAQFIMHYTAAVTSDAGFEMNFHPVVYGSHGLERRERTDGGPEGIFASDAIKYLWQKYYPQVDVSGVVDTTYPIPHAVWDDPVRLPEATADLNKYHAWKFGVWEGKRLEFAPHDFTRADWQVRAGEHGVEVQASGDSTEAVFNGATVSYTDFSGQTHFLSARDTAELRDDSAWIPANQWGKPRYLPVNISWPCAEADAIAIAQVCLAGANRAKRPSTITVPYYIRNGAGDWRPVGEVRAGDTIAVTNLVGDEPRLITATDWADHRLVISTDDAISRVEAFFERTAMQLRAAGRSG